MTILFEESVVSDTVREFRSFLCKRNHLSKCLQWSLPSAIAVGFAVLAPSVMTVISACFVTLLTIWSFASEVTEESVLIIKDFGIQLRILYRSGSEETKFLDKDKISGVIVHESIVGSSVRYKLAFLMRDEAKLSLTFTHLYPGLPDLQRVYKACADMSSKSRSRGKR